MADANPLPNLCTALHPSPRPKFRDLLGRKPQNPCVYLWGWLSAFPEKDASASTVSSQLPLLRTPPRTAFSWSCGRRPRKHLSIVCVQNRSRIDVGSTWVFYNRLESKTVALLHMYVQMICNMPMFMHIAWPVYQARHRLFVVTPRSPR